ncbi:hypothetical protein V6259_12500 [Marinomonas sp. TI.3.20]|uniref:hypothetical protein n=1 Tax=Marinomonas sp. TI.3.20 TaxID=3121296 RepID=UPI0031201010
MIFTKPKSLTQIEDKLKDKGLDEAANSWWGQVQKIKITDIGSIHWGTIRISPSEAADVVMPKNADDVQYVHKLIQSIHARMPRISPEGMAEELTVRLPIQLTDNYEGLYGFFYRLVTLGKGRRYSWFNLGQSVCVTKLLQIASANPDACCYALITSRKMLTPQKLLKATEAFENYHASGFIKAD